VINNISSLGAVTPTVNSPKPANKIKDAAEQFEGLMFAQLLKTARESGSAGWLGTGENDEAGETSIDLAEQQLASVMAKGGGLGLTKLITQGLQPKASPMHKDDNS
jgi:Rod binding domain-containing protein